MFPIGKDELRMMKLHETNLNILLQTNVPGWEHAVQVSTERMQSEYRTRFYPRNVRKQIK